MSTARQSLTHLAITAGVVLVVGVLAVVFRPDPPATIPRSPTGEVPAAIPVSSTSVVPSGQSQAALEKFETYMRTRLVAATGNEADVLRINIGEGEHVFALYFADALEAGFTHPQRLAEQSAYFSGATQEAVVETGREALKAVTELLHSRPFKVQTRWEKLSGTDRILALVQVQMVDGRWTHLADILVGRGYARVEGVATTLPEDSRSLEQYVAELRGLAKSARERRLGIWSRVKS